jgi:hypothetical protein
MTSACSLCAPSLVFAQSRSHRVQAHDLSIIHVTPGAEDSSSARQKLPFLITRLAGDAKLLPVPIRILTR